MSTIAQVRCLNHPLREAAARCKSCGHMFCRECVTVHRETILCAACLATTSRPADVKRSRWRSVARLVPIFLGLVLLWGTFYLGGRMLLAIPSEFHSGGIWATED